MKFQRLRKSVILTLSLFTGLLSYVSPQTIIIERGEEATPREGENFELNCIIAGTVTGDTSIAWAKDNQIIVWSNNGIPVGVDNTGDYLWEERYLSGYIHFTLTIPFFHGGRHNGYYKCFLAQGDQTNYTEIISVMTQVTAAYFPSEDWPKCTPNDDFKALIYTETTIRCVSTIGSPEVSMNLYRDVIMIVYGVQSGNSTGGLIEKIHSFTVMPQDQGTFYFCRIQRFDYAYRDCNFGSLQIQSL